MIASFEELTNALGDRHIVFDERITGAIERGHTSGYDCFTPEPTLLAVAELAYLLEVDHDNGMPSNDFLNVAEQLDVPEQLLADMVAANLELPNLSNVAPDRRLNTPLPPQKRGASAAAIDLAFYRDLSKFNDGRPTNNHIYVNGAQEPLLLRKRFARPVALSLAEVAINDVPYPPGSLFELWEKGETPPWHAGFTGATKVRKFEDVASARFLRLSTLALFGERRYETLEPLREACGERFDRQWTEPIEVVFESVSPGNLAALVQPIVDRHTPDHT